MNDRTVQPIRVRWVWIMLLLMFSPGGSHGDSSKVVVGIFPTYDQSGTTFGPTFSQRLTELVYQELRKTGVEPVLLNPGGLYISAQDEFATDYAQKNNVETALATAFLKPDTPKKGDYFLLVKSELIDLKTGKTLASWQSSAPVNRHEAFLERGGEVVGYGGAVYSVSSRDFEKQPLGKTARKLAEDLREQVLQAARSLISKEIAAPSSGNCSFDFRVGYVARHAVSKSYDLVINAKDETNEMADGRVTITTNAGPLLIQLSLHDAPYKLPAQALYQASTYLDCSRAARTLTMEIGPAGEAFLKWQ